MIDIKTIREFSDKSMEGKLLMSAMAILTSMDKLDITNNKYGGMSHPDDVLKKIVELANKIYYEEEFKQQQRIIERDNKINNILKNKSN